MFILAADDGIQCLIQFGVVGFFLFLSFVSWVIKQVGASGSQRALRQRLADQNARRQQAPSVEEANPYGLGDNIYDAEVIEIEPEQQLSSTLSSQHLADHAAHLGQLDDRPREETIHDHFDHQVGRLGDSSDAVHEDPDADVLPAEAVTTSEIVDVFRNPERIKEAIILNEILARPGERWTQ